MMAPAVESLDEFGSLIRGARNARGWNQEKLARRAHVSQSTISELERGTRSSADIRQSTIIQLAKALRIDAALLSAAAIRRARNHRDAPLVTESTATTDTRPDDVDSVDTDTSSDEP